MKLLNTIVVGSLALASVANAQEKLNLGLLGNLVKNNAEGDYKFPGVSAFLHNGTRAHVNHFAKMLGSNPSDVEQYEQVMMQGITSWEDEMNEKGFKNDVASALAYFTVVNVSLYKHNDYKDYLLPNLVSQYRKALASKDLGTMSNAKKQDYYDYLVAETVYVQTLASIGRDMDEGVAEKMIRSTVTMNLKQTFGVDPARLSISESGLKISN